MQTHEYVEKRFWELHDKLQPSVKEKLGVYWASRKPIISTQKADIDAFAEIYGPIYRAATSGQVFFFRLEKIDDLILDRAIVHEISHAYIFARDGTSMYDYQNPIKKEKDEREAIALTQIWLAQVLLPA